ncbi:sn-glycerol-3-phosphate import ATP-binding protein UgpC [Bauldia sp.]|uniref:sn-glycerol-3-phosphate import ATP-binding protein UgpC n=1 Tax=Bauldia sp. TaxID=2575872 RepID=UPI003BAD7D65
MARILIDNVSKVYAGNTTAIHDTSIDVADGEFIVLVGPSGCGKSTLLRMIAGLETVTDGEIRIGDRLVNDVDPADRDIAMVFQNYALYPHMSVHQNLAYGLKNRRFPRDEIESRVKEAARILELAPLLDRKPRQLSGGQRQRVAMGRAIVREPAAFLFDEPLSNLDAKLRVQMRGEIKQLQRRLKTTSIYVTHDQLEAMTLADRLVVLNLGRIEQIGTPLEVYRRPSSTFVAGFIGSPAMNLLDARRNGQGLMIGDTPLPYHPPDDAPADVVVGVRAEDLRPVADGQTAPFPLAVSYVEELGAHRLVHGHVDGQTLTTLLGIDHEVPDVLPLSANDAAIHLFDKATRLRITS